MTTTVTSPVVSHNSSIPLQQRKRFWGSTLSRWLLTLAFALQAIVVALLVVLSIFSTSVFQRKHANLGTPSVSEIVDFNYGLPSVMFIIGTIVLLAFLFTVSHYLSKINKRYILIFLLSYITILQIIWLLSIQLITYDYPDSASLMEGANALLHGDFFTFDPSFCSPTNHPEMCPNPAVPSSHAYFSFYPFQTGPLLWYMIVGSIFGSHNVLAFQIINAFAITALTASIWRLGTLFGLQNKGQAALAALLATCVPLLMFAAFVYPNAVGFSFTLAGVVLIAQAFRMKRIWTCICTLVGGFITCGIGMIFKSTYIIIVMAAFIAVILIVLSNRKYWQALVSLPAMGAAIVLSKLPVHIIEHVTHQKFGDGMPMLSWLVLGLNKAPNATAGWWTSKALQIYRQSPHDISAQSEAAKQFITERMQFFAQHPNEAMNFFTDKLSSEWTDPTFMTSLYSELGTSAYHFRGLPEFMLTGSSGQALFSFENVSQSVLYLLALIGVIASIVTLFRREEASLEDATLFARTFLCAGFLGGFICYIFWEAKGIYTLPFYLLLFPLAAYGVQVGLQGIRALYHHFRPGTAPTQLKLEPLQ